MLSRKRSLLADVGKSRACADRAHLRSGPLEQSASLLRGTIVSRTYTPYSRCTPYHPSTMRLKLRGGVHA